MTKSSALAAGALALLGWALQPAPALAQVEVGVAEREAELAQVEVGEVSLRRHHLPAQELVLWLPPGWKEMPASRRESAVFGSAADQRLVLFGRGPAPPGAGLLPLVQGLIRDLEGREELEIESVRRLRVAGRDALEVAGSRPGEGEAGEEVRMVVSLDPDNRHYRTITVRGSGDPGGKGEPLDATYTRLLRDWFPLDGGVRTGSFEGLAGLDGNAASPAWDERNRLLAAMAQPDAIGQPWFDERLRELARQDPGLMLDCALHHHPRVRIGCLQAIDPAALDEPARIAYFAAVMADPDRAVRYRAARRIVEDDGIAGAVLARLLETDTEAARSGAFQLLAAAGDGTRADLAAAALADRSQYPDAALPLVAAALAEWGAPDVAAERLREAWKRTRREPVERAAWLALLRLGDREVLGEARDGLSRPRDEGSLSPDAAATAVAVHAGPGDAEALRSLLAALDEPDGGTELGGARDILSDLVEHLDSLPEAPSADDECQALAALSGAGEWAALRRRELGCRDERVAGPVRASVPRPGAYLSALLDLVERLEVGSPIHNQAFHGLVERVEKLVGDWGGDPFTSAATGIDLEAPWELRWWQAADADGTPGLPKWSDASLRMTASDPERLLDTVARTSGGPLDLESLSQGVIFTSGLPLLPLGSTALWDEEHQRATATDDDSSTPEPTESYSALGTTPAAERRDDGWERHTLYTVEIGGDGAEWSRTHLLRQGTDVVLTRAAEPLPADGEDEPASSWSRIEVDLQGVAAADFTEDQLTGLEELTEGDPVFSAETFIEPDAVATAFRVDGLSGKWLALGRNVAPGSLRAPAELLPADSLAWLGIQMSPADLAQRLPEAEVEPFDALSRRGRRRVLRFIESLGGEAGLALVGVPDPRTEKVSDAWERHLVGYVAVEPETADRFLRREARRIEGADGRRVYQKGEGTYLARHGDFLVVASSSEVLMGLGEPPYLDSSPMYEEVTSRSPEDAMLWVGWNTDRLSDGLAESIRGQETEAASTFALEIFRALGGISGWLRRGDTGLEGELSSHPRLQSEETLARVRRLAGYGDLIRGSVPSRGLPRQARAGLAETRVGITLRLPEELPDVELDWSHERLDQELVEPGLYRFVSRAATALPERSDLTLPIDDPALLPYTRNERDLELHSDEIRELAETIRGDETDPARIVRAIVDWAHEELEYTVIEESVSTERILATRQADCTEFSQLTIALARSLGIPARPVHGAYVGDDAAYFHRWAEVHLDRWYEIDPTWGEVRIPATNVRIPLDDGMFLSSLPGVRFSVEEAADDDGGWVRRLPAEWSRGAGGAAGLAVDGERIVVAPDEGEGLLYSGDGGRSFTGLPLPEGAAGPSTLLGGHGRILRFGRSARGGDGAGPLTVHELDAANGWRRLTTPAALRGGGEWSIGLSPDGYLAHAAGSPDLRVLGPDLALRATVPLPGSGGSEGAGEWTVAREGGLLAHAAPGEGITLHTWEGDSWADPVPVPDSADLAVVGLVRSGEEHEIAARQRTTGRLLWIVVGPSSFTRRSLPSGEAQAIATTTRAAEAEWTAWIDGREGVLTRKPL